LETSLRTHCGISTAVVFTEEVSCPHHNAG